MFLGAFGKHPGWNDHIDDIGLESERLVRVKSMVYLSGIGARIDSGAWESLPEVDRLPGFDHLLLMRWPGELVLARLWSSTDGKGRSKYPMIIAAHCVGVGLEWALANVAPELERLREQCQRVTAAQNVIEAVDAARARLRGIITAVPAGEADATVPTGALSVLFDHPDLGPGGQGLQRVLYQVQREGGSAPTVSRPLALRVPRCATGAGESIARWAYALLTRISPGVPLLLAAPMHRPWVDVIIGEALGPELLCLRAAPGVMPLTSEVPYSMDDAFVSSVRSDVDASRRAAPMPIRAGSEPKGSRSRLLPTLMVAAVTVSVQMAARADAPPPAVASQPAPVEPAEPRDLYNAALRELAAASGTPGASDDAVAAAIARFTTTVRTIPGGVSYLAQVEQLMTGLQSTLKGEGTPNLVAEDLSNVGPAATGVYRAVPLDVGRVRFEPIAPSSSATPIEFERISPSTGAGVERPFYLARTELSVAQALGIVRARHLDAQLRTLMPPVDWRDDAREGIRTWEWPSAEAPLPRVSTRWFGAAGLSLVGALYPSGAEPKAPQGESPMQQIAPADALLIVSALGCRLPTAAEWQLAAAGTDGATGGAANLRDKTWSRQQAHVEAQRERGRYLPSGDLGTLDAGVAPASTSVHEQDDGVLWLAPVSEPAASPDAAKPAPAFMHLFGNVAEYVLDRPTHDGVPPTLKAAEATELAAELGPALRIVGASALTPPSVGLRDARPIPPERLASGWADVGVRPAFTAPGPGRARSLAERVQRLLDPLPLLERR